MPLAVDIGNTNIKLGLFDGNSLRKLSISISAATSFDGKIIEFIRDNTTTVQAVMVSSVVPDLTRQIITLLRPHVDVEPHIISHRSNTGLSFSVPFPERVGSDRITAAAWAYHYFGAAAAVIDFGTATTISVVGRGGVFIGGTIIPGLRTMASVLNEQTAALPLIDLEPPAAALGRDTREAITSGIVYGTAGAVSRIIYEIEQEIGYNLKIAVTGGNLSLIEPCLERFDIAEPDLLISGLNMIYERIKQLGY